MPGTDHSPSQAQPMGAKTSIAWLAFLTVWIIAVLVLRPFAQAPVTSYELSLYEIGATAAMVVREIPFSALTCGQPAPERPAGPVVNPTRMVISQAPDGTVCTAPLTVTGLPAAEFDITLRALNAEGHGVETPRLRFVRQRVPDAPPVFYLVRE